MLGIPKLRYFSFFVRQLTAVIALYAALSGEAAAFFVKVQTEIHNELILENVSVPNLTYEPNGVAVIFFPPTVREVDWDGIARLHTPYSKDFLQVRLMRRKCHCLRGSRESSAERVDFQDDGRRLPIVVYGHVGKVPPHELRHRIGSDEKMKNSIRFYVDVNIGSLAAVQGHLCRCGGCDGSSRRIARNFKLALAGEPKLIGGPPQGGCEASQDDGKDGSYERAPMVQYSADRPSRIEDYIVTITVLFGAASIAYLAVRGITRRGPPKEPNDTDRKETD